MVGRDGFIELCGHPCCNKSYCCNINCLPECGPDCLDADAALQRRRVVASRLAADTFYCSK